MKLIFSERAWEDYLHWQATDRQMVIRINRLIQEIRREPFSGIGKPESAVARSTLPPPIGDVVHEVPGQGCDQGRRQAILPS